MENEIHHENVRNQYAQRILTYETAARWMLDEDLLRAQKDAAAWPASPEDNQCLDLCCGTGIAGRSLIGMGWKVRGLDLTPEMAWVASQYFPVKIASIEKMPYADKSFDLAVLRQSMMLIHGPRALKEVYRVLKPGGRLILIQSIPFSDDDDPVYAEVQMARHINLTTYYRAEDLESSVRTAGFSILNQETLRVRESVDHWLSSAPELNSELRTKIRQLIAEAPDPYKNSRSVEINGGELFEDWNWLILTAQKV